MIDKNVSLEHKKVLITGVAGFIGANLAVSLLRTVDNIQIIGIDNLNDYYDVSLKEYRLKQIISEAGKTSGTFTFIKGDIAEKETVFGLFQQYCPDIVVNLAAQAGVRYSIINPDAYIKSNLIGFYHILEACRHSQDKTKGGVEHLVYASSSSVYGSNKKIPYSVNDKTDYPVSLYAATKKSNELLAYTYAALYGLPSTGLRFFTVYGPAGRPDMAYFDFTNKMMKGETIKIFNHGNCKRDFTYIDDIVNGVEAVLRRIPKRSENGVPCKIYNIGNNSPENLLEFVHILEHALKCEQLLPADYDLEAHMELVGMQPGDVEVTYADITEIKRDFNFQPKTDLRDGMKEFAKWYKNFYVKGIQENDLE